MGSAFVTPSGAPLIGTQQVLWSMIGANMNITTDQAFLKLFSFNNHTIEYFLATNASASLTAAIGGIYTSTAKGGSALVAAVQVFSALTNNLALLKPTLAISALRTNPAMYLSLTVPQGSAATCDLYAIGVPLS